MKQPQQAHSGLQTFGRVIGFFLLFIFILLIPIYTILFGISRTVLSENYLKARLTDGTARSEGLALVQTQLGSVSMGEEGSDGEKSNQEMQSAVATSPAIKNILEKAVSDSTFNTVIDTVLTNVFDYLKGEKDLAEISISTTEIQKNVLSGIQDGITSLPVCGPGETSLLEQRDDSNSDGATLCKPAGVSDAELQKFAKDPEFTSQITEAVPATIMLTDLPNYDEVNYQASQVRHYYTQLTTGVIFGGLALVLALILGSFLWHQHLWHGLQTLGITLFIPLAVIFGLTTFGRIFLERLVVNETITQDATGIHGVAIGWHIVSPVLAYLANLAGVLALFGLVLFVIMEIIRHMDHQRNMSVSTKAIKPAKNRAS